MVPSAAIAMTLQPPEPDPSAEQVALGPAEAGETLHVEELPASTEQKLLPPEPDWVLQLALPAKPPAMS